MKKYTKYNDIITFFYDKSHISKALFVKKIKKIKQGFINKNYYIKLSNNSSFQIRKANKYDIINRQKEFVCLNIICSDEIIFYDYDNGDMIRKWFDGKIVSFWNSKLLYEISNQIKKYQAYNIPNIDDHDHFEYLNYENDPQQKQFYLDLIAKYDNEPKVFCHNDLTKNNIIINKKHEIKIIDFEFARYNSVYWEFANFAKDSLNFKNVKKIIEINNFDWEKFIAFLIITIIHAIQWTYSMGNSKKIKIYQKQLQKKLCFYKKKLNAF